MGTPYFLRGAAIISRFSIDASAIQSVVYDFTHGRGIRVDIHPVTGAQVAHDTLSRNVKSWPAQLREAACLYMVNSQ
jgi:hypothetical protein